MSLDSFPLIIPVTLISQLLIACTVIRNEGMNAETCKDTYVKIQIDTCVCTHKQYTLMHTQTFPPQPTPTSQWPSQSSVLTPMELISHGSTVHLLPQTLGCSHIMLTQSTITSACLHCSCGTIKKTRTRGCPVGCNASSLRFNVNLILSLVLRRFRLHY